MPLTICSTNLNISRETKMLAHLSEGPLGLDGVSKNMAKK